jgi:dipeptidyl aminopeptidase/acylaminoacyl peptidase
MKRKNCQAILACMASLCLVFSLKTNAQVKKELSVADYALWKSAPKIIGAETSADGNWYVYKTGSDSCVNICLKQIKGKLTYNFKAVIDPNSPANIDETRTNFSEDSKYYAFMSNDTLKLIALNSCRVQTIKGISDFQFAGDGQYLFGQGDLNKDKKIWLRDLKNQRTISIDHVEKVEISPSRNALLAIVNKDGINTLKVVLFKPGFPISQVAATKENHFDNPTWNKLGNTLGFYETKRKKNTDTVYKIHTCSISTAMRLKSFDPVDNPSLPKNYVFSAKEQLHLSADGKQLFFYLLNANASKVKAKNNGVEVWLPTDLALPAGSEIKWYDSKLWYQWTPENDHLLPLTNEVQTSAALTGNEKKVLIYSTRDYLPQYKYTNAFVDVYIKDLATGRTKLLLKKVWTQPNQVSISPGGKFVAYFKAKHWWVYDIDKDSHRCLTEGFKTILENIDVERVATVPPYGSPGWLQNDSQLIIYDQNDIWLLSPDGKTKSRITIGAETNKTYRLYKSSFAINPSLGPGAPWFGSRAYNETDGLLVSSTDNETLDNGLHMWTSKSGLTSFMNKPMAIQTYGKVSSQKPFLFTESNFSVPPRLMLFTPGGKTKLLYETDPHQKNFKWGKSEVVHFTIPNGKRLKGALFYPADYVAGKRYPMVVEIYEKMSQDLHDYQPPSLYMGEYGSTLNTANYTSEGYFVLLPDISYEHNDPGISATKCVVAAVEKVIEMGLADRGKIGLTGGSFGGFESAFIATQTDLFKTAVPMCGITDLPAWSLLISQFGPNFTRVEEDQFRMTKTFMGEDYFRNSPMHYIHQMKTPILLISGDKDPNVDVSQSKSFHNALWRLGKQSTMLIYQGEGHAIMQPENQLDASHRIKNWFDHYLKGEKPADWMAKGIDMSTSK